MSDQPIALIEAITQALAYELRNDSSVVVLGEESYLMVGFEGKLSNKWVQVYTVTNGLISRMEEFATSADADSYMIVN